MSVLAKKISRLLAVITMLISIFTVNVKPAEVKAEASFTISNRDYIGILGNFTSDSGVIVIDSDFYDPNYEGPGFTIFGEHGYYVGKANGEQPKNLLSEKYGFQITNGNVNLVQTGFFIRKDSNTHKMYLENYDVADDDYYRWLNEVMSTGILPEALFSFEITADLSTTASFNVSSQIMQDDLTLYFVKINNYPFDYKLVLKNKTGETIKETQPLADSGHTTWPFIYIDVDKEIQINKVDAETQRPLPGATLAVYDANNVKLLQWISDDQSKTIHLPEGTYMLVEESAPRGYKKADPKSFIVDYSTNDPISIRMEDVPEEPEPELGTTAINKNGGGKIINNKQATIIDTIEYNNLDPKSTYRIEGKLVTKSSNGKNVVATNFIDNFKPNNTSGEVKMEFSFDASNLNNQELVVFEYLLLNNEIIAMHEDINDKAQTVKVELSETVEVQVVKTWNDGNNKDNTRPNSIIALLLADGEEVDQAELNEENEWRHTFTDLPKFRNNKEIVYTINEKDVPKNYELSVEGYTLTNSLTFGGFKIIKTDQNNEPVAGAKLQIINNSGQNITLKNGRIVEPNGLIEEVTTSNDGVVRTSEIYPKYIDEIDFQLAKYRIEEQTPPNGYYAEDKVLARDLTISAKNDGINEVEVKNKKLKYRSINIHKAAYGPYNYHNTLEADPVPGATLLLINSSDFSIFDKNGREYKPYDIIDTLITDESGFASTDEILPVYADNGSILVPVSYSVIEKTPPTGFKYIGPPFQAPVEEILENIDILNIEGYINKILPQPDFDSNGIIDNPESRRSSRGLQPEYKFNIIPYDENFQDVCEIRNINDVGVYSIQKAYTTFSNLIPEEIMFKLHVLDQNENPFSGTLEYVDFIEDRFGEKKELIVENGYATLIIPPVNNNFVSMNWQNAFSIIVPSGYKIKLVEETASNSKIYSILEIEMWGQVSNDFNMTVPFWIYIIPDFLERYSDTLHWHEELSELNYYSPDTRPGTSYGYVCLTNIPNSPSASFAITAKKSFDFSLQGNANFKFALKENDEVVSIVNNIKEDIKFNLELKDINVSKKKITDFTDNDWEQAKIITDLDYANVPAGLIIYIKDLEKEIANNNFKVELGSPEIGYSGKYFGHEIEEAHSDITKFKERALGMQQLFEERNEQYGIYGFFYDDTREYTISEIIPEDAIDNIKDNIEYDLHEEKVTVRITGAYGSEPIIDIEYDSDGAVFTNVYHEPKTVKISKVNIAGEELENASIQILDINKNIVEEWVSTKDIHEIQVQPGTYIFHEKAAPKGYQVVTDITFNVDEDGKVIVENTDATASDNMLVVTDDLLPPNKTQVLITKTSLGDVELPGAKMTVRGDNFEETWTSTNTAHSLLLEPGNYELEELLPPNGFKQVKTVIKFEVLETGKVNLITTAVENGIVELKENNRILLKDAPVEFEVEISKQSINGTDELPGAELKVSGKNFLGEGVEISWTSLNTTKKIKLLPGSYTLTEIAPPDNFQIAESIDFTIDNQGNVISDFIVDGVIVMKDVPIEEEEEPWEEFEIVVSKVKLGQTEELSGAELRVIGTDADNSDFAVSWISGGEAKTLQLKKGAYTLIEDRAPLGFDIAESIKFAISESGEISVNGSKVAKLVMEDKQLEHTIKVSKINIAGEEIPGAKIQIKDSSSNLVHSWTSEKGKTHEFKLLPGNYIFHEEAAPNGYLAVSDIKFTVELDGKISVQEVKGEVEYKNGVLVVTDKAKPNNPVTPTTPQPSQPVKQDVKTGAGDFVVVSGLLMLFALNLLLILRRKIIKN